MRSSQTEIDNYCWERDNIKVSLQGPRPGQEEARKANGTQDQILVVLVPRVLL